MIGRAVSVLLIACAWLTSQGCTCRARYEGLQEKQRQECYGNASQSDVQKCLDRVNETTYDQYTKGRENTTQPK